MKRLIGHIAFSDELARGGKTLCGRGGKTEKPEPGIVSCSKCCAEMRRYANEAYRRLDRIARLAAEVDR